MSIWNWWAFAAASAWMLFSLALSPVYATVAVSRTGFGAGIGFAVHLGAVRRAQLSAAGIRKKKTKAKQKIRREILSYLLRHVKIERIFISGILSFEDAMTTALIWGGLNALSHIKPLQIQNTAQADFTLGRTNVEITGILSVPAGHIMIAAMKHASIAIRERRKKWKNIRSKA